MALKKLLRSLCIDAEEAAEQPLEFSLLVCLLTTVVDAIVALAITAIRRCCRGGCCVRWVENLVPDGAIWMCGSRAVVWWVGLAGLVRIASNILRARHDHLGVVSLSHES